MPGFISKCKVILTNRRLIIKSFSGMQKKYVPMFIFNLKKKDCCSFGGGKLNYYSLNVKGSQLILDMEIEVETLEKYSVTFDRLRPLQLSQLKRYYAGDIKSVVASAS